MMSLVVKCTGGTCLLLDDEGKKLSSARLREEDLQHLHGNSASDQLLPFWEGFLVQPDCACSPEEIPGMNHRSVRACINA